MDHHHVVGDMDIDIPPAPVANAKADNSQEPNHPSSDRASDGEDEDEDEETRRENRRRRAEKRKGKRPEQTAQQKADARAARRRARAEADEEAYREAYRPILTIKHSQGFVWNQVGRIHPPTAVPRGSRIVFAYVLFFHLHCASFLHFRICSSPHGRKIAVSTMVTITVVSIFILSLRSPDPR